MTKTLTLIGICVAGAILAQMFLKLGLNRHGPIESFSLTTMIRLSRDPLILAAVAFYSATGILWIGALSRVDLSFAYPLLTLSVAGVALVSSVALNEPMNLSRAIGTLLAIAGAWLVLRS